MCTRSSKLIRAALGSGLLVTLFAGVFPGQARSATYLLQCDRLFDGVADRVTGATHVLVRDGSIAEIGPDVAAPPGAETIDLPGMTLTPGLIDAHTHTSYLWPDTTKAPDMLRFILGSPIVVAFGAAKNLERTLEAGFTTIREMSDNDGVALALQQAQSRGWVRGPRLIVAGPIYVPSFGGRTDLHWPADGAAATREEVIGKTRQHIARGYDWIKFYATGGTYSDTSGAVRYGVDEIRAAVEVAHPRGIWVAAHVMGLEGARRAVAAGVRSLEHGSRLDEATAREMAKKKIYLVPTLYHMEWYARHGKVLGYSAGYKERLDALQKIQFTSVGYARKAGVAIACGSDAVYSMHGENAQELVWLVRAGLSPIEALRAATSVNAALLGLESQIGRIAPNFAADLVAFPGDPSKDIDVVAHPAFVMHDGEIVKRP